MSKFDEKILFYKKNMTSMGIPYEDELFNKITRGLGPSIFKRDAASVSTSDEKEIFTVKHNFLINNLLAYKLSIFKKNPNSFLFGFFICLKS